MSSFEATNDNAETDEPVYTPSVVSNDEPTVSTVAEPDPGAVHENHTDAPPAFPA